MKRRPVIAHILAAAALGQAIALAQSPPERSGLPPVAALQQSLVDVIARVEPAVVAISRVAPPPAAAEAVLAPDEFDDLRLRAAGAKPETVAAGVLIDPAGLVLTEFLAVREGELHSVTLTTGESYPARIKAADPRSGLAVLEIMPADPRPAGNATAQNEPTPPAGFPALPFGDADQLRKGQFVVLVGNPYAIRSDGQPTASWGIIANLAQKAPLGTNLNDTPGPARDYRTTLHHFGTLIQTDARLGLSAGGGALVNLDGELIGLTTIAATIAGHEQPAGYAIPMNSAFRRIIDVLRQGREVEYGLLGVNLGVGMPGSRANPAPQVTVQFAYAGGPGDRAGLKPGDVILGIGGKPARDVSELQLHISLLPPSTETTIEYMRGGERRTARVALAKLGVPGNKIVTDRPTPWRGIRVDYATALDALALGEAITSGALDPQGCVLVTEVTPHSDADRAGVRPGMFISHVGGRRVASPAEFYDAANAVGDKLDIRLTKTTE